MKISRVNDEREDFFLTECTHAVLRHGLGWLLNGCDKEEENFFSTGCNMCVRACTRVSARARTHARWPRSRGREMRFWVKTVPLASRHIGAEAVAAALSAGLKIIQGKLRSFARMTLVGHK